jgi:thioredoxin-related protein
MVRITSVVLLLLAMISKAESQSSGTRFEEGLSWEQVKAKAKAENKHIFVDCYTTWCGPCKRMEKEVFPDTAVSDFMNKHFVAVRVQMDKTSADKAEVQNWYGQADKFAKDYSVDAYPTYLFFSSDGKALHKFEGFLSQKFFIVELRNALDPLKQFYTRLEKDNIEQLDTATLKAMALSSVATDAMVAGRLASEYLSRLSDEELSGRDVLEFMMEFPLDANVKVYAIRYIERLSVEEYKNKLNKKFISNFSRYDQVRNFVRSKLLSIQPDQLDKLVGYFGLFRSDSAMRLKFIDYFNQLSTQDIFKRINLVLCQQFSESTKDPWFKLFYNKALQPRLDSSIRSVPVEGVYYLRIKDVANAVFINEYLLPCMTKVSRGEVVDWQKIASQYQRKFRRDFVDENILHAQVQVWEDLKNKQEKYLHEYIRLKLLEGERYGWDTTSAYIEGASINSFLWNDVFMHSDDKEQLLTGAKWMMGIIRRNPEAHLLDHLRKLIV